MPIYMKIDGIDGDSADGQFAGWMELMSYGWGVDMEMSTTGGGGGTGKAHFQDLHFTKQSAKGSPAIMLACASGKHLPAVQIVLTKPRNEKPEAYLKITLTDVLVSSYRQMGDSGGIPIDEVGLVFAKIRYDQAYQRPNGATDFQTATWNLKTNTGG